MSERIPYEVVGDYEIHIEGNAVRVCKSQGSGWSYTASTRREALIAIAAHCEAQVESERAARRVAQESHLADVCRSMGARLKARRVEQGLSVPQLASRASVGRATVYRVESGRNTSVATLELLSMALDLNAFASDVSGEEG